MSTATLEQPLPQHAPDAAAPRRAAAAIELLAVLASPAVLFAVLQLRGMSPVQLPDPSMHTTFILDPHDIFARYTALFTPKAMLREGARVGFLIPARVAYLLFGAVPGFFVFRYVLALIAIIPTYLLLRRLYGRWAGFLGIAIVMSSPVLITAWGTDYPDSAAVSYLTGGLAALALSLQVGRWRRGWVPIAGSLLTLAVWSHGAAVPLVAVTIVVYLGVHAWRAGAERAGAERAWRAGANRAWRAGVELGWDLALLAASALAVTGLLAICSGLLLGQFDFITPTVQSAQVLSRASELSNNHSSSWSWAPYDAYLLVPPAIIVSYFAVLARRRGIGTTQLFVGLTGALQLATFAYLQFFGSFQALEMPFFSSTLWSSITLMLAITVAEVAQPIARRGAAARSVGSWLAAVAPALLVLAVAGAYEGADKLGLRVPALTWSPWGLAVAALVIVAVVVARLVRVRAAAVALVVLITGAALVLTVAPEQRHGPLAHTVYDPAPAYAGALGGDDTDSVSEYAVVSRIPGFVGHAAYKGEVLLTWAPTAQFGDLLGPLGIYHNARTLVCETFPVLTANGASKIEDWHAAQVLLMSLTGDQFAQAVRALAPFEPVVVRRATIIGNSYQLHLWLVDLRRYLPSPPDADPGRRTPMPASS